MGCTTECSVLEVRDWAVASPQSLIVLRLSGKGARVFLNLQEVASVSKRQSSGEGSRCESFTSQHM